MWIPGRQRWILRRTEGRLRRSCPDLAAMLAIFTRLTAGEAIESREQLGWAYWGGRGLAWLGLLLAATASGLSAGARWVAARLGGRLDGTIRRSVGFPPAAGHPGDEAWPR